MQQRPNTVHPSHVHSVDSLEGHRLSAEAEDLLHQMKASGQLPPDFQQRSTSAFPTKDLTADPGSVPGSLGAQSRASPQGDGKQALLGSWLLHLWACPPCKASDYKPLLCCPLLLHVGAPFHALYLALH